MIVNQTDVNQYDRSLVLRRVKLGISAMRRLLAFFVFAISMFAQRNTGEIRLTVVDPKSLAVQAEGDLLCRATAYHLTFTADAEGKYVAKNLPFGIYQLQLKLSGFAAYSSLIEIRSELPKEVKVPLALAPVETALVITDAATLVDPNNLGDSHYIGPENVNARPGLQPGRGLIDLVQSQPGWVLEANGTLHPRGSEYQVQYVVDGIPITDNRSPGFAPNLEVNDVQSMNILTANYPAEYGRKLGGIVEINDSRDQPPGFHGKAVLGGDSFNTQNGYVSGQYKSGASTYGLSVESARTSRYLDPPVQANDTNNATTAGMQARFERDLDAADRVIVSGRWDRAAFLVPNERLQEAAGQRQDRNNSESEAQIVYQRILSPSLLLNVRAMGRDLSANLWSNDLSTPIMPFQERGFREAYTNAGVSGHWGRHEWKAGVDAVFTSLHENFSYVLTNPALFDPNTPARFAFRARAQDREQSGYVQDQIRAGRFTISAGVRWDHYKLLVPAEAVSPRLGVSYWLPSVGLVLRASYDRVFQTPAIENLLLAGSAAVEQLNNNVLRLPVPPSRGNFYQFGFAKNLFGKARLDGNYYRRDVVNFADDDLLLNTGVTFPIAFAKAAIQGVEAHLELPRWGPWTGFLSYSNMTGTGFLPIRGGLFLGDGVASMLTAKDRFPVSQDQRNTGRGRLRFQPWTRAWLALEASFGSGLPVQLDAVDLADLRVQYGQAILDRVNFERGRVRPSFSLDASAGVELWKHDRGSLRVQADVLNVANRLNVINFEGLLSGTAIGQPRSFALRTEFSF